MLFYTVVTLVAKIEDALNQIWRLPHSRTWSQKSHGLFERDLSRAGNGFYGTDPHSFGSKLLVGGAAFRDRICELSVYFDHQRHAVCPALRHFHLPLQVHTLHEGTAQFCVSRRSRRRAFMAGRRNGICRVRSQLRSLQGGLSSFAIVIVFLIWLYTGWLIFLIGAEVTIFINIFRVPIGKP